jgi:hypothetical protein
MDPLNPIIPDRDPVIPEHRFPAVQRVNRDAPHEHPDEDRGGRDEDDEEFDDLLEEAVYDDLGRMVAPPDPDSVAEAVEFTRDQSGDPAAEQEGNAWNAEPVPGRRASDAGEDAHGDDERPGTHIDISA